MEVLYKLEAVDGLLGQTTKNVGMAQRVVKIAEMKGIFKHSQVYRSHRQRWCICQNRNIQNLMINLECGHYILMKIINTDRSVWL